MGKLFVIDGTDGSGKQTQLEMLKSKFDENNVIGAITSLFDTGTLLFNKYFSKSFDLFILNNFFIIIYSLKLENIIFF